MSLRILFLSTTILVGMTAYTQAGTHVIDDPCTSNELGATEMEKNQTGIIGCFKDPSDMSKYKWKSLSAGTSGSIGPCYTAKIIFNGNTYDMTANAASAFSATLVDGTEPMPANMITTALVSTSSTPIAHGEGGTNGFSVSAKIKAACTSNYVRTMCSGSAYGVNAGIARGCSASSGGDLVGVSYSATPSVSFVMQCCLNR